MAQPSLPSFAATFKDVPPLPPSRSQQSSPFAKHQQQQQQPPQASRKRPYDAVDPQPDDEQHHEEEEDDSEDDGVYIKEEPRDDEQQSLPPSSSSRSATRQALPPINTRPNPRPNVLQSPPSPMRMHPQNLPPSNVNPALQPTIAGYSVGNNTSLARKKRRVTVSSTFHQHNPSVTHHQHPAGPSYPHAPSNPSQLQITPGSGNVPISPVVMGFVVPPEGVGQLKSALTLKYQQKALIEQRRNGGVPTTPATTASSAAPPASGPGSGAKPTNPAHALSSNCAPPPTPPASGDKPDQQFAAIQLPPTRGITTRSSRSATVTHGSVSGYQATGPHLNHQRTSTFQPYAQQQTLQQHPPTSQPDPSSSASASSSPHVPSASSNSSPVKDPKTISVAHSPVITTSPLKHTTSWQAGPGSTGSSSSMTLLARRRGLNSNAPDEHAPSAGSGGDQSEGGDVVRRPTPALTVQTTPNPTPVTATGFPDAEPSRASDDIRSPRNLSPSRAEGPENRRNPAGPSNRGPVIPPRNPLMSLDPVIRSAPIGGRMIHGFPRDINFGFGRERDDVDSRGRLGRKNVDATQEVSRNSPQNPQQASSLSNRLPPSQPRVPSPLQPQTEHQPARALPSQLSVTVPQHSTAGGSRTAHPLSIDTNASMYTRGGASAFSLHLPAHGQQQSQVPISTTLRTPRAPHFPAAVSSGSGSASATPVAAVDVPKQAFLNMFGEFYDSLQGAQHLKAWLEGQITKSDSLISSLQRAQSEVDQQKADLERMKHEYQSKHDANSEVQDLRSRVRELELRLERVEDRSSRSGPSYPPHVPPPPHNSYGLPQPYTSYGHPNPGMESTHRSRPAGHNDEDVDMSEPSPVYQRSPYQNTAHPPPATQPQYRRMRSSTTAGTMTVPHALIARPLPSDLRPGPDSGGRERSGSMNYARMNPGGGPPVLPNSASMPDVRAADAGPPRPTLPGVNSINGANGRPWPEERGADAHNSSSAVASNGGRSRRSSNAVYPPPAPHPNTNAASGGRRERRDSFSGHAPPPPQLMSNHGAPPHLPASKPSSFARKTLTPPERPPANLPPPSANGHDSGSGGGLRFPYGGSISPQPDRMLPPAEASQPNSGSRPSPHYGSPALRPSHGGPAKEGLLGGPAKAYLQRASSRSSLSRPASPARRASPLSTPNANSSSSHHRLHVGGSAVTNGPSSSSPSHRMMDIVAS